MTIQLIITQVKASIAAKDGLFNYDYWKGYCECFDRVNNNPFGQTWELIKKHANVECGKYKRQTI